MEENEYLEILIQQLEEWKKIWRENRDRWSEIEIEKWSEDISIMVHEIRRVEREDGIE